MMSEMKIRKFTDKGVEVFRSYLEKLRAGSTAGPPYDLLTDPKTSQPIKGEARVIPCKFETRLDVARYFDEALAVIEEDNIETDVQFWSWLSLFYFDQVCPPDRMGKRKPGRNYRHILEPGYRYGHRHLLGGTYLVYTIYGCGENTSSLLLYTLPNIESQFNHELATRQSFITNRGIMEAAYQLYFDPFAKKGKRGSLVKKRTPGTLYRFVDVIQQLDLNYDLYSMTGKEIISILPTEFHRWKQ
ncbi:hypothetical protein ACFL9U_06525 [Thermodesulfobacteriota bacterium]